MPKRKPKVRQTISLCEAKTNPPRVPGKGRGKWVVSRNFDAPLPDDLLNEFGS